MWGTDPGGACGGCPLFSRARPPGACWSEHKPAVDAARIFKLSKSHTDLLKVAGHRTNRHHAEALVWAWLLMMVALSTQGVFRLCGPGGGDIVETSIFKSVAKVVQWFAQGIELACARDILTLLRRLTTQQEYHDRYEKRRRISIPDRLRMALEHGPKPRLG